MLIKNKIYYQIKYILYQKYPYPMNQIQPEIQFSRDLALDSFEMFELIEEFEKVFKIIIDFDDIDKFIFQPQTIKYVNDIKYITIQDTVLYIERQIMNRSLVNKK